MFENGVAELDHLVRIAGLRNFVPIGSSTQHYSFEDMKTRIIIINGKLPRCNTINIDLVQQTVDKPAEGIFRKYTYKHALKIVVFD